MTSSKCLDYTCTICRSSHRCTRRWLIEGYTGLTQILSDRTLSNTCMPTNVTSSSAPEYYFGCYKVCISFPQKYYNKGPPRDRSERQHGPENWQQSSQKAPTHVDRKGGKLLLWQWCIHFLSCKSDICNSLLHFGCISGKITNSLPLFPEIFYYFLWRVF